MVKSKLHSFPVGNVKIVEDVDESEFGSWYFQVSCVYLTLVVNCFVKLIMLTIVILSKVSDMTY